MRPSVGIVALGSFVLGAALSYAAKVAIDYQPLYHGKEPKEAAAALLGQAEKLAGEGSWERIGVGRVYYLSGEKAKGQALFDGVLGGKKVATSDLFRIATVYAIAKEPDKAGPLFERAIAMDPESEKNLMEAACWFNMFGKRERAEQLFDAAFALAPDNEWLYISAAASYVGVQHF
jgi:tetratricopeptide (TPR) repeat protein